MARTVLLLLLPLLAAGSSAEEVEERGREARQLGEQEQKYDLELSFPVEGDEATNIEDGQRKRIDSLIRDILLLTKVDCRDLDESSGAQCDTCVTMALCC